MYFDGCVNYYVCPYLVLVLGVGVREGWTSQVDEGVEDLRGLGCGTGALSSRRRRRSQVYVQVHDAW